MAHNKGKYTEVLKLPEKALPVQSYADERRFTVQWLYKLLRLQREGKRENLEFKMIVWKGHNYILPLD